MNNRDIFINEIGEYLFNMLIFIITLCKGPSLLAYRGLKVHKCHQQR